MSETWLPGPPAHISLRPRAPVWEQVDSLLASMILEWTSTSEQVTVRRMQSSTSIPLGYYCVGTENTLFVKVAEADTVPRQLYANKIANWLSEQDCDVSVMLSGYPRVTEDNRYGILVYRNIEGRFAEYETADLSVIGSALGKLHTRLQSCPWKDDIEVEGSKRQATLTEFWETIIDNTAAINLPVSVRDVLIQADRNDLMQLMRNAQVVHGDLNYGNVIIRSDDGSVVFLDFEDTCSAWFSPLMELAFVIERFVLTVSDELSVELAEALISSYKKTVKTYIPRLVDFAALLRGLSIRALLLLSMAQATGNSIDPHEWSKFVGLYNQANLRADLLKKISLIYAS